MIDHIEWHTDEDFPEDIPQENALNHMGFYWAWAVNNDLVHHQIIEQMPKQITAIKAREMTGKECISEYLGKQLQLSFFNTIGARFAAFYYEDEEEGYGNFIHDYVDTLEIEAKPSLYHTEDSWENYDKIAPVFERAYNEWYQSLKVKN